MSGAANPLRVALLTHGGADRVLERLAALEGVRVVGVLVETETTRPRPLRETLRRSIKYDGYPATLAKLARKLSGRGAGEDDARGGAAARDGLREIARARGVPVHLVKNFHDPASIALLREAAADLGVVYGTNIIKETVFGVPRLGSINLHQGLAPFYRGGPPVFWELFNGERELGLTVHSVAAKVDAGEIILQQTVPLAYDYAKHGARFEPFVEDLRERLREPSAALVAEAVRRIADGTARPRPQDISLGARYRLPTKREKDELRRRLRARYGRKLVAAEGDAATPAARGAED